MTKCTHIFTKGSNVGKVCGKNGSFGTAEVPRCGLHKFCKGSVLVANDDGSNVIRHTDLKPGPKKGTRQSKQRRTPIKDIKTALSKLSYEQKVTMSIIITSMVERINTDEE